MKSTLVILLLLIFSVTQFGNLLTGITAPVIHAICYGKVLKRRSTSSGNQLLSIDTATFRRSLTDDNEIRYAGQLFDILSVNPHGNTVQLQVVNDEFETTLSNIIKQLREAVKKASGSHHSGKRMLSWLLKLYCPYEGSNDLLITYMTRSPYNKPVIPVIHAGVHTLCQQPPDLFI